MYDKDFNYGYVDLNGKIKLVHRTDNTSFPNDEWAGVATAPYANKEDFMNELHDLQSRSQYEIDQMQE